MPYYRYQCECGHDFEQLVGLSEDSMTFKCPVCEKDAKKVIEAPGVVGLVKGPNMKKGRDGHQVSFWKPDPVKDCAIQFKAIEDAGKMTPEMRHFANIKMTKLREAEAKGKIKKVDFQKDGHYLWGETK